MDGACQGVPPPPQNGVLARELPLVDIDGGRHGVLLLLQLCWHFVAVFSLVR
jgi:hypothetical protein